MKQRLPVLLIVLAAALLVIGSAAAQDDTFALTILHTNDTHAAHQPNGDGNGGAAREAAVVKQVRAEGGNVLLVDAGDRFTGTLFHRLYLGQDQVEIMNLLGYDVMTLGNHEFDNGEEVLLAFIQGLNFPVVSSNIDFGDSPLTSEVAPYAVLEVGGEQIGIIGLTTPDTTEISSPSASTTFNADLVGVVESTVDELTGQGINKIILITHTGILVDEMSLAQLSGVDIFVGGHSHTLLSNTYSAAADVYPITGETAAGEPILYVQAGSLTQYLGRLDVEFNADGVLTDWGGDTILLARYITPDPEMEALINDLAGPVQELQTTSTGATAEVALVGDRRVCRVEECDLGNIITNAMLAETGAQIAIMNGGGIRADIDEGDITVGEVLTVLPFGNLISTFELSGADVIAALENGVSGLTVENGEVVRDGAPGRFPQVAGVRFSFDPTQEPGSRVVSVEVLGEDGSYSPIDPEATYAVVSNDFMRGGGDGYAMFAENAINPYDFGRPLDEALANYLIENSPVAPSIEGRITIVNATVQPE
ncbi:MAG: 5'-nucleotidase C-terminal domain-containing protein [Anaerolineae bacterium]|nr:5'-nucleotidase C-terminal domain-containing protein [Anaerolineae bacterium]